MAESITTPSVSDNPIIDPSISGNPKQEVEFTISSLPTAFFMKVRLPDTLVKELNDFLDQLRKSNTKKSHSHLLVGQIENGEQLTIDHYNPNLKSFVKAKQSLGVQYINHFQSQIGCVFPRMRIELDALWSKHSFEGDYNPLHDHIAKSLSDLSFAGWTMVPDQITRQEPEVQTADAFFNSSGVTDGTITFHYENVTSLDLELLRPPQMTRTRPEPGLLCIFPSRLQHVVYPFKGAGERRTIAGNMSAFKVDT